MVRVSRTHESSRKVWAMREKATKLDRRREREIGSPDAR
jgi:hypothetical protein